MDSRHLPLAAYSAFAFWLLKLRGVPVAHLRLLTNGCPVEELPALVRELKRVRTDFKRRLHSASAPAAEPLREAYAALGVPWSGWSEVEREVHHDLKRKRHARWSGGDAIDFPEGPPYPDMVSVLLFGGAEPLRPHLVRRASLAAGSLEGLWCAWLAGEPLPPDALRSFVGPPEQLAEPLHDPGLAEVLPLFFVEPDVARAEQALAVASARDTNHRLVPLMKFLRALPALWRQDTSLDTVRARFDEWLATVPPSRVEELVAPAWLLGRYVEPLPASELLTFVGARLPRLAVPERVADVRPVMEVLSALEELATQGRGIRVERQPPKMILSAQAPLPAGEREGF